eukprot:scaffold25276_cov73-Isochrysis_galbana.AAC.1
MPWHGLYLGYKNKNRRWAGIPGGGGILELLRPMPRHGLYLGYKNKKCYVGNQNKNSRWVWALSVRPIQRGHPAMNFTVPSFLPHPFEPQSTP